MAKKPKKAHILVIRLSAMGDVAMTVPVLLALRAKHPKIRITVLTKPQWAPIFQEMEGVFVFAAQVKGPHKGLWGLWKLYRALGDHGITHVADLHNVLRSKVLGFYFRLGVIPVAQINKGRKEKRALTRKTNKVFVPLKHTMERYQSVFNSLGFSCETANAHYLSKQGLTASTERFFGTPGAKRLGIAPFAAHDGKMYQLALMEEVIRQLLQNPAIEILLFGGGRKEAVQLQELQERLGDRVVSLAGTLSLKEELIVISHLDAMLAMDSGNGHLAANYGVPVVTLWGVTHPYAGFAPFQQPKANGLMPDRERYPQIPTSIYGNSYPEGYGEAINSIKPQQVVKKLLELLN